MDEEMMDEEEGSSKKGPQHKIFKASRELTKYLRESKMKKLTQEKGLTAQKNSRQKTMINKDPAKKFHHKKLKGKFTNFLHISDGIRIASVVLPLLRVMTGVNWLPHNRCTAIVLNVDLTFVD